MELRRHVNREFIAILSDNFYAGEGGFYNFAGTFFPSQSSFQAWQPPRTHDLGGWQHSHNELLKYLLTDHLYSLENAIKEINQLNWLQARILKLLYSCGLRGANISLILKIILKTNTRILIILLSRMMRWSFSFLKEKCVFMMKP